PPTTPSSRDFWSDDRKQGMQLTQDLSEVIPEELKLRLSRDEQEESLTEPALAALAGSIPEESYLGAPPPEVAAATETAPPEASAPGAVPATSEAESPAPEGQTSGRGRRSFRNYRTPVEPLEPEAAADQTSGQSEFSPAAPAADQGLGATPHSMS